MWSSWAGVGARLLRLGDIFQSARLGLAAEMSQPHGTAAPTLSAGAPCGGAVSKPIKGKARLRPIPIPAQITMRGSCDFFKEQDAVRLQEIVGAGLLVEPERVAGQLNFLSEDFFLRFAFHHAPTSDSKTAEWCRALIRDVGTLLESLGCPDMGYPENQMFLQTRIVLTNIGTDTGINEQQIRWMRFGENVWEALDRVPAALWFLKKATEYAAGQYQERAAEGRSRLNSRQTQHVFLLGAVARLLRSTYGVEPPKTRPHENGPFVRAVDFVRLKIIEGMGELGFFTDQGTDDQAARRLHQFTPSAAASLWAREGKAIRAGLANQEDRLMMERSKPPGGGKSETRTTGVRPVKKPSRHLRRK